MAIFYLIKRLTILYKCVTIIVYKYVKGNFRYEKEIFPSRKN